MKNKSIWVASAISIVVSSCATPTAKESVEPVIKEETQASEAIEFMGGSYTIDAEESVINWKGTEITTEYHVGTVNVHKGSVDVVDKTFSKGFIAIDMNSIVVTDEDMGDKSKQRLTRHLKSEDFFGVEQFPFSRMDIAGIKSKESVDYAYGKIFVREIAQPITFPIEISEEDGNMIIDASITFDRSKHNVKFRSGAFPDLFPDLGDKLINDDIELNVHIVATL